MIATPPFDDSVIARQILADFDYMQLSSVATDFAAWLGDNFAIRDSQNTSRSTVPSVISMSRFNPHPGRTNLYLCVAYMLVCGTVVVTYGSSFSLLGLPPWLVYPLLSILGTVWLTAISALALRWVSRQQHRRSLAEQLANHLCEVTEVSSRNAWESAVHGMDGSVARTLVGRKTLVEKRPLDYALEGAFSEYGGEDLAK
jgi:hypothetical protein